MQPIVFPEPRDLTVQPGRLHVDPRVHVAPDATVLEREAATLVARALREATNEPVALTESMPHSGIGGGAVLVGAAAGNLSVPPDPQGYTLEIDGAGVRLRGTTPLGTWYGAQTLRQLIELEGAVLPHLTIRDWPHLRYRGLFVECKWGPDRMTLEDWKAAVDACAALKFNHLGVGVYGCWVMQYDNEVTEFLMLPLPEVPGAATPKTIRYYSPAAGGEQTLDYLPAMFADDFFGDLVAYGQARGVAVRPQFNSLGHNTLIPRLAPEVSARDEAGNPTGYGYCLSAPETDRLVFGMYDRIVDTYLLPHGVSSFHIGLDEVWSSIGIDPQDPHRVIEPWCKCPRCREQRPEDLFIDWMLRLCRHLREHGVEQIALWNDQLTRHMDLLTPELAGRIEEMGLNDHIVIEWWWYHPEGVFPTLKPELGLKRWVVPMTGYFHWVPYQSYLENIRGMMAVGVTQGAEGTESYCTFDRGFDRNYRYQAEWAWNPSGCTDVQGFKVKYAKGVFGTRWEQGLAALDAFDQSVAEGDDSGDVVRRLMPYRYTYVTARQPYPRRYPREILEDLRARPTEGRVQLARIARSAAQARLAFVELTETSTTAWQYAVESERIESLATTFLTLLGVDSLLAAGRSGAQRLASTQVRAALARYDGMMAGLEGVKDHYLLPQMLRDLTSLRAYLARLLTLLVDGATAGDILLAAVSDAS
jgi:hypothetical protein